MMIVKSSQFLTHSPVTRFRKVKLLAWALASLFVQGESLRAEDWPQWRGSHQDGVSRVPAPGEAFRLPAAADYAWRIRAGEGFGSPVVAGGKVWVMDHQDGKEVLNCLDATSGQRIWKEVIDEAFKDNQGPAGPRSTPTVSGDRVLAVSCRGRLQCRNAETGALVWEKDYHRDFGALFIGETGEAQGAARHGNTAGVLVREGRVYALAGGLKEGAVVCLNLADGSLVWKALQGDVGYAPPVWAQVGGTDQLVCFLAHSLVGLDPAGGKLLWEFPMETRFSRHVMTPVVDEKAGLVAISSNQQGLIGLKLKAGDAAAWKVEEAWRNKEAAMNFSSPVLSQGNLYGLGAQRNLVCVEMASGATKWSETGFVSGSAGKAHASFLAWGSWILALLDSGELLAFQSNPAGLEIASRVQGCGQTWSSPALDGKALYLKDGIQGKGAFYRLPIAP